MIKSLEAELKFQEFVCGEIEAWAISRAVLLARKEAMEEQSKSLLAERRELDNK